MSDTPIDGNLDKKFSVRAPPHLVRNADEFKEAYNDRIGELDLTDEQKESYRLETKSEARRRLLDIGLGAWAAGNLPPGFSFDIGLFADEGQHLQCQACGNTDQTFFRLLGEEGSRAVLCLACDSKFPPEDMVVDNTVTQ